jgi:hypothetical protein
MSCHAVSSCSGVSMSHGRHMISHVCSAIVPRLPLWKTHMVIRDFVGRNPLRNQSLISVLFAVALRYASKQTTNGPPATLGEPRSRQ